MSAPIPQNALDTQFQALLKRVADDRDQRCAALRAAAESEVRQIVRSSRSAARAKVHDAVIQERARLELGMRQAAARADIEAHRQERRKEREILEHMWTAIEGILERRWRDPKLRRAWIDAALSQAAALLAGRGWIIELGSGGTEEERGELADRARGKGAGTMEYSLKAEMPAGLRIRADGVCVDATVPGLLAQRKEIEAAFLAEYIPALAARKERTDA